MFDRALWDELTFSTELGVGPWVGEIVEPAVRPARMGRGTCAYPKCYGGGGFHPCVGFTGTAEDCLNCGHPYGYHA